MKSGQWLFAPVGLAFLCLGAGAQEYTPTDPDFRESRSFYLQGERAFGGAAATPFGTMRLAVGQWTRIENGVRRFQMSRTMEGQAGWIITVPAGRAAAREEFFPYLGTQLVFNRKAREQEVLVKRGDALLVGRNLRLAVCPGAGERPNPSECWTPAYGDAHLQASWDRHEPRVGWTLPGLMEKTDWSDATKVVIFQGVSPESARGAFLAGAAAARDARQNVAAEKMRVQEANRAAYAREAQARAAQVTATLRNAPPGRTAFCSTGDILQPAGRLLSEMTLYCDLTGRTEPMNARAFLESGWAMLNEHRTVVPGYTGNGFLVEVSFQKR